MATEERKAWVVRMRTGGGDVVGYGLRGGYVCLGWSDAEGLLDCGDYWRFRDIVHDAYHSEEDTYVRSGRAASQLWNFIHEVREGDVVLVPHPGVFYAGVVTGPVEYKPHEPPHDTAHRRSVRWLNAGEPIPRQRARSALISRMRSRSTVTGASDLLDHIDEVLQAAGRDDVPSLAETLRDALVETTKQQLLHGHMDSNRFEDLVRDLMEALGGVNPRIVARRHDIGADIETDFSVGHFTTVPARIQVKYWRGQADRSPIDQLLNAMDEVDLGVVVTTAEFTEDVRQYAADQGDSVGKQLVLIDGDELCRLVVDHGLDTLLAGQR